MYEKILKAPLVFTPDHLFSPAAKDLITGMLQKDPAARLGSSEKDGFEIREHPVTAAGLEPDDTTPSTCPRVG